MKVTDGAVELQCALGSCHTVTFRGLISLKQKH